MGAYTTKTVTEKEYKDIVKTIREGYYHNGVQHEPNKQIATILVLEANLGCRIGDIINLTTESIVNDGGIYKLNIVEEKTGKKRNFIVPVPVKRFIDKYTREAGITEGKLFTIKKHAVWKQLRAATDYLGLKDISSHSLRKYRANALYEASGHDIDLVCTFLQHSDIRITRAYIRRSDEQLEKAIRSTVNLV